MNENDSYNFDIKSELDFNIGEAIQKYKSKGIKKSENEINILLKKKSRTDDALKQFMQKAQKENVNIDLSIDKNKITITKETKHE